MKITFSFKQLLCVSIAMSCFIAGPVLADPPSDWSGPYVGGFAGGNWSDFGSHPGSAEPSGTDAGFLGGGDIGNNWQFNHLVLGAEGDFSKLDNNGGSNGIKFTEDWQSTLRGRVGYSIDRLLPYVTGGLAMTDTVAKVSGVGSEENVKPGYALGGGVDAMLAGNWFARVEYLHTDVPSDTSTIGNTPVSGGSGNDAIRVGVNYRF